jgi:SPP1 family phage portal protein
MRRLKTQKYPDYTAEIEAIEKGGITDALLNRIIRKHEPNATYNRLLIERYEALEGAVPIFERHPRFEEGDGTKRSEIINHKINNDFFSEIVDFKVGYFAGNPIAYSYSDTEESLEDTGEAGDSAAEAQKARDEASKKVTDFTARSNMFDVDMETTKFATICGYSGRLFYFDPDGEERAMPVPPNETIILSKTKDITQPTYGVRYYTVTDINDKETVKAEFYDSVSIYYAEGAPGAVSIKSKEPNLYSGCPLQGIPNNREMLGDAEKVIELIDAYDRALSDTNNEVDSFANAYMVYENVNMTDDEIKKAQHSGAIQFFTGGANGKVYFLTKDINDGFLEHHLDRLEKNIYRFSKTPNLGDEAFGTASGISLKFKLTGLETKCGMFEAKMISAGTYMFQLLAKAWEKKQVKIDPLQCVMEFKRNFPLDTLSEAQAAQALISAGVPKRVAYQIALSCVDDVEYVMQEIEKEKDDLPSLMDEEEDEDFTPGKDKKEPGSPEEEEEEE